MNRLSRRICGGGLVLAALLLCAPVARGATEDEVIKSISQSVGGKSDPTPFFWGIGAIVAVALLLSIFNRRGQREAVPKALHNPGKLLKQLVTDINLGPTEMRQLKTLAEAENVQNPLTLLLCPSLLSKAIKENPQRVDPKTVVELAKRFD